MRSAGSFIGITIDEIRLSDYDDNGFLGYQRAALGEQESGAPEDEALHPYGFASRALDPDVDDNGDVIFACLQLTLWEGSETYSIALNDARKVPILATLKKGESLQYGPAGNFVRCHADGRVSRMATTDGTENGQLVSDTIGPEGYERKTPWSVFRDDATGFHYECGAATLDLGQIQGLPAPFAAFSSYCDLQAHTVRILGSGIQLGVGTGRLPIARATPLQSALTAAAAAFTALGSVPAISANAAAAAALTAAASAIAAALPLIPSTSTTAT